MVKKFFRDLLASFMGAWIALLLFGAVATIVVFGIIGSLGNSEPETVKPNSILYLQLEGDIEETERPFSVQMMDMIRNDRSKVQALNTLVRGIEEGIENRDIKVLYIECRGVAAAPATLHALRDAVLKFKKSGKKVIAYGDYLTQGDYYVASVADRLYLNKMGNVTLTGLSGTSLYYKDLLDKLGVKMQVFRVGTYKSAVEPVISNEMSEPARAQMDTLFNTMWGFMRDEIASARKLKPAQIDSVVNSNIMFRTAETARKYGLVDSLITSRQVDGILAREVKEDEKNLNYVAPALLAEQANVFNNVGAPDQVAVLYAVGEIAEGSESGIDCETLVPVITELADDDNVKAMVLRVNSPGGSVFGSAEIGEALEYFQSKKKPIVVSMGDYAASGGYWISCHANKIFADPLTLTGSIGVFGMIPDISGLMGKLGVTPQTVSTNPGSRMPNLFEPLTESQSAAMQQSIEEMYRLFVNRVATGRKLSDAKVRNIAEGRVWSAITAKKIGLVDQLGSLDEAIEEAAKLAKIAGNHSVVNYPQTDNSLLNALQNGSLMEYSMLTQLIGTEVNPVMVDGVYRLLNRRPELALMPIMIFN